MGVLKDHMSYLLVSEMRESTDFVTAYTLRINYKSSCKML